MNLGLLGGEDANAAFALSAAEGWNQTAADWRHLTRLEAAGCFAARAGQRLIGTVTTTTYGRALAWIGMMVVHPDFRRQGVGAALMRLALAYVHDLGIASVKLDATPAGRPLYESLGFVAEAELQRWQGVARPAGGPKPRRQSAESLQSLLALDKTAFGADRSRLLELLIVEGLGGPQVVGSSRGTAEGYAIARQGRTATYIGPIVATSAAVVGQLLDGVFARFAGEDVCLDVHGSGLLEPIMLEGRGLSPRRSLTRMRLGIDGAAGAARMVCASAGPEFG